MTAQKRIKMLVAVTWLGLMTTPVLASEAETSASARGGRDGGEASAAARYDGHFGFARTNTQTGRINRSRAVAVGVDEDGVSVSLSTAVATRRGPAVGANLNFSLGRNGQASVSRGTATATGGRSRAVTVGGHTQSGTRYRSASSTATAGGRTSYGGVVRSNTRSETTRAPVVRSGYRTRHETERRYRVVRVYRHGR